MLQWAQSLDYVTLCNHSPLRPRLNVALVSRFATGKDGINWHRDRMACLGQDPFIASLSFGAPRDFGIRHIASKEEIWCPLHHGSIVVMLGRRFQEEWKHCVPKTPSSTFEHWNVSLQHHLTIDTTNEIEDYYKKNRQMLDLSGVLNKYL